MMEIGIDHGGKNICVEQRYMRPTAEYPQGSYLHKIGDNVIMATGWYEKEYPGHPSLYFHGGPPFVMINTADWECERNNEPRTSEGQGS